MGSSNFVQFNSTKSNMASDAVYDGGSFQLNGVPLAGLADPLGHNKLFYQLSTFVTAFAQVLANEGYTVSDSSITALEAVITSALAMPGRLLNVQTFTSSGTYTPTTGMNTAIIEVQGAGGGGGGCPSTLSTTISFGVPGSSGSYAKGKYTAATIGASQAVTVGASGAGGIGGAGSNGGASSFGSLISAPGGLGGASYGPTVPPFSAIGALPPASPSGGNIFQVCGSSGNGSFMVSNQVGLPGIGGPSIMGGNDGYGSGGSGEANQINSSVVTGLAGGAGLVVIYEYA